MALDLTKFKVEGGAQKGPLDINKFKVTPSADEPMPTETPVRPNLSNLKSEAATSEAEAKKLNSFTGVARETGKNVIKSIFSSEVSTGETLGQSLATGQVAEQLSAANESKNTTKVNLIKKIRENRASGADNTRLIEAYNSLVGEKEPKVEDIVPAIKKTNRQALGDVGGVALDVLSAGTYGKAATGMKAGVLVEPLSKAPTAVQIIRKTAQKPAGLFTKTSVKRIAASGATGYGYDVVQNAKEGKTGGGLFMPGLGTVIGVGIPTISAGVETAKRGYKIYTGKIDDSMRAEAQQGLKDDWNKFFEQKKSTKRIVAKNVAQGRDPAELLSEGGYIPKISNDRLETGHIIDTTTDQISDRMDAIDIYLEKFKDKKVNLSSIEDEAKKLLNNDPKVGADLISSENELIKFFQSYRKKYGEIVDPTILNNIRKEMNNRTRSYKDANFILDTADAVGKATRTAMDAVVDSPIVREVNAEIGQIGTARSVAEAVNGDVAKAGKIGKHFARIIGSIIGTASAGKEASGTRTAVQGLLGSIGGDTFVNYLQQTSFTNPNRTKILKTIVEDRTLMDKLLLETSEASRSYLERELRKASSNLLEAPKTGMRSTIPGQKIIYATPGGVLSTGRQEAIDAATGEVASKNLSRYANSGAPDIVQATSKGKTSILRYSEKADEALAPSAKELADHFVSNVTAQLERNGNTKISNKIKEIDFSKVGSFDDIKSIVTKTIGDKEAKSTDVSNWLMTTKQMFDNYSSAGEVLPDGLMKEAGKYKTVKEFIKKYSPLRYTLEDESYGKVVVPDMWPNDLVKGKGITKSVFLDSMKDWLKSGHKIIEPSNGIWTKDGDAFIQTLVRDGYVEKIPNRGGIERYGITDKIKSYSKTNALEKIWETAEKAKNKL